MEVVVANVFRVTSLNKITPSIYLSITVMWSGRTTSSNHPVSMGQALHYPSCEKEYTRQPTRQEPPTPPLMPMKSRREQMIHQENEERRLIICWCQHG